MYDKFLLLYNMNSKQGRTMLYIQLLNVNMYQQVFQTIKPMIMTLATFGSNAPPRGILIQEFLIGGWFQMVQLSMRMFAKGVLLLPTLQLKKLETVFSHRFHDAKFH